MRLAEIHVFPVKSLRGGSHKAATVDAIGLRGDRRWMVVDAAGQAVTQREIHAMALVQAEGTAHGVTLVAPGAPPLAVPIPGPDAPARTVLLWRQHVAAVCAGAAAGAWLSRILQAPCALVYLADESARTIDPAYAAPTDRVSFADGFPLLLATRESLADLNARLSLPISMQRFRPNLVIEGAPAWAEDKWRRIRIGSAVFRAVKPCDRCIITTIDPETARPSPTGEPLHTLKTFRWDNKGRVLFGQNLVPDGQGYVAVGDAVVIKATA